MAFKMNGAVFFPVPRGLAGHPAGVLWGYLRQRMGKDGGPTWPARDTIASDLGVTWRTIVRRLRWLERHGWLVRSHPKSGRGYAAYYWAVLAGREAVENGVVVPRKGDAATTHSEGRRVTAGDQKGDSDAKTRVSATPPHKNHVKEKMQEERGLPAAPPGRRAALEEETDPARRAVALAVGHDHFRVYLDDLAIHNTDGYTIDVPDWTRRDNLEKRFGTVLRSKLGQVHFVVTAPAAQGATSCG